MEHLSSLADLACRKKKELVVSVAAAGEADVLNAVSRAMLSLGIIPVLTGDKEEIAKAAEEAKVSLTGMEVIHASDTGTACREAVRQVRKGKAGILMKGHVQTSILVREILDKESGLLKGRLLSHVALFETPYYHKLLALTDAALNIDPGLEEKADIVRNAVELLHRLGIERPKVGILAAVETVNEKMVATVHASLLKKMNLDGRLAGCLVDGPFALDNAISGEAAKHKGILSEVAGDADLLVAPDLNSGNILYKSLNFLGGAVSAALVTGAEVPVILTSRSDSDVSKFYSLALAAAIL